MFFNILDIISQLLFDETCVATLICHIKKYAFELYRPITSNYLFIALCSIVVTVVKWWYVRLWYKCMFFQWWGRKILYCRRNGSCYIAVRWEVKV